MSAFAPSSPLTRLARKRSISFSRAPCSFSISAIRTKITSRISRAMTAPALRFLYFTEALAFCAYVGWYIWQLESSNWSSWIVFPVWLIASIVVHKDTPKTLGWRADNLWNATKRAAVLFLPSILVICALGIAFGGFPHSF